LPFGMLKSLIDRELLSGLLILLDFWAGYFWGFPLIASK
jgi:hypothetical protein